jgi:ubiquitin C-terminal hydrolase
MVHDLARQKGREIFTGWAQNDLSEFLLFMVECMHNCIARKAQTAISGESKHSLDELAIACYTMLQKIYATEYSEIMDLFYGISVSEIWDIHRTHRHSVKPESYFMVDLPIPGNTRTTSPTTLYDCFNEFTKREELTGENAWWNEKTNQKEDIAKNMTFWNFPKILVITLKRFSPDGQHKNNELVDFPLDNLVLSPYVSGYNPSSYVYELYGVCNHIGSVHGGHYTAFVKRAANQVRTPERGMSEEGRPEHVGEWVHFNDSDVSILPNPEGVITPMAYCLFYRKKNTGV